MPPPPPEPQALPVVVSKPFVLACTQSPDVRAVSQRLLVENSVLDAPTRFTCASCVVEATNIVLPVKVLLSDERSVVDATTIFAVPLNETPLIVRAF